MLNTDKVHEITDKIGEMQKMERDSVFSQKYYSIRSVGIKDSHGDTIQVHIPDFPELEKVANLLRDYVRVRSQEKQKELEKELAGVIANGTV